MVPVCTITSCFEKLIKFGYIASLIIFLCFTITPFGLPVEPDVYITYIISSVDIFKFKLSMKLLLYMFGLSKSTYIALKLIFLLIFREDNISFGSEFSKI